MDQTRPEADAEASALPPDNVNPIKVVAIGASAGGLEALQQLFASVPGKTGLAFVVVQHLSPDFKSLMPELLGRQTLMPVIPVDRDVTLQANTVYVLSAGFLVELHGNQLKALPRAHDNPHNLPINRLFESLQPLGERAAAVVLSGTGQDGMAGTKLVKQAGGLVIAQIPSSARFDSMPRAVIDAGIADIVALPAEIGKVLTNWLKNPDEGRKFTSEAIDGDSLLTGPYGPILNLLKRTYDLDFAHYKSGTIMRRIDRWLTSGGRPVSPATLAAHLEGKQSEIDRLFGDLLIGVTSFFRDADAFDALRRQAIEPLVEGLGDQDQLRIWCCGCSTGEEAYTLAILAHEAFEKADKTPRVRIMATDVHAASVQRASTGVFTEESLGPMPQDMRAKYFVQLPSGHYKVVDFLRRYVVFSVLNVLKDAGFQRMDIVCCRNLLIYLRPTAQGQALASFHMSLHANGMLLLGKSEMPSEQSEAFIALDESSHIYRKRPGLQLPIHARPLYGLSGAQRPSLATPLDNRASFRLQEVLAQHYVPDGFLVNQNDELVYVFGHAGDYLRAAPGRFGGTLFNLLTGPLRTAITISLRKSAQSLTTSSMADVVVDESQPDARVQVHVDPISDRTLPHHYFMVRIEPMVTAPVIEFPGVNTLKPVDASTAEHIAELESELMRTREALQRSIEDLEAANEELQAGNEELMAANEELQSTNEELHALNEELYSVNAEHELKIQELRDTSTDLNNLIRSSELALIFLDLEARLRLFTPPALSLFPLRPEDSGRELRELVPLESDPSLFEDVAKALVGDNALDHELNLRDGRIMRRRVTQYRSDMGVTCGVVITYTDVTQQVRYREQQLMVQHQAQLAAIMESVPHLMWTTDANGHCDFLNKQWVAYTGLAAEPQLGEGWLEQVHPDDHEGLMRAWLHSVETTLPFRTRFRIRRHDGTWRWFDTQGVPQKDESGKVLKWFGSNTDIHDVIMLQFELEQRDKFTQMVADNINGMVGYWDCEQRNRFANSSYWEWFGKKAADIHGHTLKELLGDALYAQNKPHIEAVLRGEAQHFERTITKPDGSLGHLWAQYLPHIVDGQVQGFISTATDITQVQEARLLADRIFEVSPVAKMIFDSDGHLARWNQAAEKLLGYPRERLTNLPLETLIPQPMRKRHNRLHRGFMAMPEHRPMGGGKIFPLVRADGTTVDVEIDLSDVLLNGRRAAIAMLREGETKSDQARQKLDLALQARNRFLAQMSHEIRTPLNAILGMAQLLEMESPTPKQLDRLRRIEEASNLLLGIVSDVLDLSKMEAGKLQLEHEPILIKDIIDHSTSMIAEKARVKQLDIQCELAPTVPTALMGDGRRIEQILVNLLSNAVKFTHDGGITINVSSAPAADNRVMLRFEVSDTGIGIPAGQEDELFTPFRQVHEGHTRRYGGTGLGLSICRQLSRAMHGECGVLSTPGVGSTFWFTVLLDTRATEAEMLPSPNDTRRLTTEGGYPHKRVLIVEDNAVNRIVIYELLTAALGVQITEANDGLEALEITKSERFDLVLMDIQMPGMDGMETTRRLRTTAGYESVPIYALTANVHPDDINACLAAGMNGHFGKPLMVGEILQCAQTLWGAPQTS